jgi:hypothetical protein
MNRLLIIAAIVSIGTACSANESACVAPSIEPVQSLTTQQVGQLATHQVQTSGQHSAVLWSFDEEDRPRRGAKIALGFLLVSTGDIGSQPVGALIWTDRSARAVLKGASDGFVIEFANTDRKCADVISAIHVRVDGTVVADDRPLGRLK